MSALAGQRWLVVGTGRAGTALAAVLHAAGAQVDGWSRTAAGAARASGVLRGVRVTSGSLPSGAWDAVLLTVPDDALDRVVRALGGADVVASAWLHASGARDETALHALGAHVGTCHPLQTLTGSEVDRDSLRGAFFAISGDAVALDAARALALSAGGVPGHVPAEARVAYHLAAVLAGNGVFALLEAARDVCDRAGIDDPALRRGLAHLAARSAGNAADRGVADAATGPVVRGDASTVQRHRAWAADHVPDIDALYVALAERLLELAPGADTRLAAVRAVLAADATRLRQS